MYVFGWALAADEFSAGVGPGEDAALEVPHREAVFEQVGGIASAARADGAVDHDVRVAVVLARGLELFGRDGAGDHRDRLFFRRTDVDQHVGVVGRRA